jgi:hypothetical protein
MPDVDRVIPPRRASVAAILALAFLCAVSLSASGVHAQTFTAPSWLRGLLPGQAPAAPVDPLAALGLSEDQKAALGSLAREQALVNTRLQREIFEIQKQLPALYSIQPLDEEQIVAAYSRMFALQEQAIISGIRAYNAQLDLLDEEQLAIWKRMHPAAQRAEE